MAGTYSTWYHNWASDGSEVSIDIPKFTSVFACSSRCGDPDPDDYNPILNTFAQEIFNQSTMSPAQSPLNELYDKKQFWLDVMPMGLGYSNWARNNEGGLANCASSCYSWHSLTNWFCYKHNQFCYWSGNTLANKSGKWYNEYIIALKFEQDALDMYEATVIAIDDEVDLIQETIQIDIMKAELQIALAEASEVLSNIEYQNRMNKTKSIFIPIIAIMLVVIVTYLVINNQE